MKNHWNNVREFFKGKKTYIFSCVLALYSVSKAFGYVNTTQEQDMAIFGLLGGLMGVSYKAALARMKQ